MASTQAQGGTTVPTQSPLPPETQRFLENFYDYLYHRDAEKVRQLYVHDFNDITERHYAQAPWPSMEAVMEFYRGKGKEHQLIYILYQELYNRHLYSRLMNRVTWQHRLRSWQNYSFLMEFFISNECDPTSTADSIGLPAQWVWDIFDEFVFQYQDTQRQKWRLLHSIASGGDVQLQEEGNELLAQVWDTRWVLNVLYQFVEATGHREAVANGTIQFTAGNQQLSLREQIGYSAAISLLRLNTLFCDYGHALKCVEGLPLGPASFAWRVPNCYATLHYNVAFARLMSKQYKDAAKAGSLLLHVADSRHSLGTFTAAAPHSKESMARMVDKTTYLLIITDAISPEVKLDDSIQQRIREGYSSFTHRLNKNFEETLEDLFHRCRPKFVSPAVWDPNPELAMASIQQLAEISERQKKVFLRDLCTRSVSTMLSFAKLYNNVSLTKLAALMNITTGLDGKSSDEESVKERVRSELLAAKLSQGQESAKAQMFDFVIDDDTVHIITHKPTDVHIRQYNHELRKVEDLLRQLQNISLPAA